MMLREPVIRPMSCADLAEVASIERVAHTPGWSEENFLREMSNACGHAFVAHHEHRIVGYLVFWMICDETHLLNLTIHPDSRRCGVGKKLMAFLIRFSHRHGVTWIGLEVRRSNHAALGIYRTFGFRKKSVRRAYYQDNHEDGIVMELGLDREPK